jgi:hypothetical protein
MPNRYYTRFAHVCARRVELAGRGLSVPGYLYCSVGVRPLALPDRLFGEEQGTSTCRLPVRVVFLCIEPVAECIDLRPSLRNRGGSTFELCGLVSRHCLGIVRIRWCYSSRSAR